MIAFNIALWVLLIIHFLAVVILFTGTFRGNRPGRNAGTLPVTVAVLPGYDDEELAGTLGALQSQDYDPALFHIMVLYPGSRPPERPSLRKGDVPVACVSAGNGEPEAVAAALQALREPDRAVAVLPWGYEPGRRWLSVLCGGDDRRQVRAGFVIVAARRRQAAVDIRNLDRLYWQTAVKGAAGWGSAVPAPAAGICLPGPAADGPAVWNAGPGAVLFRRPQRDTGDYLATRTGWLRRTAEKGPMLRGFMIVSWSVKMMLAVSVLLCLVSIWQVVLTMLYVFIYAGTNLPLVLRGTSLTRTGGALGQAVPHQLAAAGWDLMHLPRCFLSGGDEDETGML